VMKKRLLTIADMVSQGCRIADIGTDHGFLPIELVRSGKVPYAIAMDIVNGPLSRAKEHILAAGLDDRIECRLSDGFDKLNPGEADTAIIAGMGGDLIADIIARKPDVVNELILSPHTHYEKVRKALRDAGYSIIEERMIIDLDKYYVFIRAIKDPSVKDEAITMYDYFGPLLIKNKDKILHAYLMKELEKYQYIEQKQQYIQIVKMALEAMR